MSKTRRASSDDSDDGVDHNRGPPPSARKKKKLDRHSEDSAGESDDDKDEDSPQWKLLETVKTHLGPNGGNSNPYNPALASNQERTPAQPAAPAAGKKKKEQKQKIVTGYILYSSEVRKAIIANNPESTFGEISRIVGNEWSSLPAAIKQSWQERAARCNEETSARLAEGLRELTQHPPMEMTYECAWDTCDYQFEDLADCMEHCIGDGGNTGHVQQHHRGHADFPCVWRNCPRVPRGQAPFPNLARLLRHVRDVHVNKGNGKPVPVHERSRNFIPSSKRPQPPKTYTNRFRGGVMSPGDSVSREQDQLSRVIVIEQCRFCGEFSKDCVAVSSDMTYLAGNKTTLALNDTSIQLDFNHRSLPKAVCRGCDAKLQEFCDFFNVVKAAQGTLVKFETGAEFEETRTDFVESTADFEERAEDETETVIIKTEYDSQQEDSDDNKEGIVDSLTVGETVFVRKTHNTKSDRDNTKPQKLKTKEKCGGYDVLIVNIKEEVVEKDANDGHGQSEVSDTGTDVKPSELELATSALVFEMAKEGTSEYQGYRSDR